MAEIADQYYEQGLTQNQIARTHGYSRSAISRMLNEARDKHIVQIQINYPLQRDRTLERTLERQYDLQSAFVVKRGGLPYRHILRRLGRLGANYVIDNLPDESILGISWGTTIFEVSNALTTARRNFDVEVIHMMGTIGKGDPFIEGHELVRSIANSLGGKYHELHSPLIVENKATQKALLNEPNIRETLDMALDADLAIVGVGSTDTSISTLMTGGNISKEEMQNIQEQGAVGDICLNHYDQDGKVLDIDINQRVIGIDIKKLAKSSCRVVGVAGDERKASAILGALRGGFLDVLITDTHAARSIIDSNGGTEK
ncbi:MAG: sugar-binding transcriptional regulator [Chloroflexi bacterium]|nr:sugar-binding transcriptional regulator [Chloroflexota bacterium]